MCTRGVARGGPGGQSPLSPKFSRSVNPIQTRAGGRLYPSHYCQPPRIQKAIYTSVHGATNTISQKFSQASLNFQLFFFVWLMFARGFFHFPISKYVLPSTLALPPHHAMPMQVCISFNKKNSFFLLAILDRKNWLFGVAF